MSFTRTNLPVEPCWQSPGSLGCWEVAYSLDNEGDLAIVLAQGLSVGPSWFVDVYSTARRIRLPEDTASFMQYQIGRASCRERVYVLV